MSKYLKLSVIIILSFMACSQDNESNQSGTLFELMIYESGEISTQNYNINSVHTQLQCSTDGSNFLPLFETDTSFFFEMDTRCCYSDSTFFDKGYFVYEYGTGTDELAIFSISTSNTITESGYFECQVIDAYTNQPNNSIIFDGEKVLLRIYD